MANLGRICRKRALRIIVENKISGTMCTNKNVVIDMLKNVVIDLDMNLSTYVLTVGKGRLIQSHCNICANKTLKHRKLRPEKALFFAIKNHKNSKGTKNYFFSRDEGGKYAGINNHIRHYHIY